MDNLRSEPRLSLLSTSHFALCIMLGGSTLLLLGIAALGLLTALMPTFLLQEGASVEKIAEIREGGYVIFVATIVLAFTTCTGTIGNFRAGRALSAKQQYRFCRRMGWWNCFFLPFGTILGVVTLIRLSQREVKQTFTDDIAIRSYGRRGFSFGAVGAGWASFSVVNMTFLGAITFFQSFSATKDLFDSQSKEFIQGLGVILAIWIGGMLAAATANNWRLGYALLVGLCVGVFAIPIESAQGTATPSLPAMEFLVLGMSSAGIGGLCEIVATNMLSGRRPWTYKIPSETGIKVSSSRTSFLLRWWWRACFIAILIGAPFSLLGFYISNPFNLLGAPGFVAIVAFLFWRTARKRSPQDPQRILSGDQPPVIYLRSFASDAHQQRISFWSRILFSWFNVIMLTRELRLAKLYDKYGPLIAVGRPDETLPELGAARLYVGEDGWRAVVIDLIRRSKMVVLEVSDTPSLRWEISQIVQECEPEKLRLFFSEPTSSKRTIREQRYAAFKEWAASHFPRKLPESIGRSQFLYFLSDPRWQPKWSFAQLPPGIPKAFTWLGPLDIDDV